jgi:hypothetical protein
MKKYWFIIVFMCFVGVAHAQRVCRTKSICLMWPNAQRIMEIDQTFTNNQERAKAMMDEDIKSGAAIVVAKGTFIPKVILVPDTPFIVVFIGGKEFAAFNEVISCPFSDDDDVYSLKSLVIKPLD